MLRVIRVHLPSEIPIVGCKITPYVVLRRPDESVTHDDVSESNPCRGFYMRYKWYRLYNDGEVAICSVHPNEQAKLQCLGCIKTKVPITKSYHCSPKCFSDAWHHHRGLHEKALSVSKENGNEEEPNNGSTPLQSTSIENNGGETWFEVGHSRTYTPTADDIGHMLKFECVPIDSGSKSLAGSLSTILTSRVIPAPCPTPRCMIPVNGMDINGKLDSDGRITSYGTFTVLSYNVLSDMYASTELHGYCPSWALSWTYRRQNLLREIVGYHADILCLQEVQSDHFDEFYAPELDKHGYQAIYKKRAADKSVYNNKLSYSVDGCATFFRRDKFSHVKKYEVEFNKAAKSLIDAVLPPNQKNIAVGRLIKDNIALIVVLEAKFNNYGTDAPGKRLLLCVANTHVNVHPDHKDVKIWQVQTLVKGLEKIAVSADIPMLVCGDFDSVPGSAPHTLLAAGSVEQNHPDLAVDPLNILRPTSKLSHQLPLVSAYSSFARSTGVSLGLEQQRKKMDQATFEPQFTSCTRDFIGTLDYIFYTADSLLVESLLELLDEESLRKDTALPSPEWSSDHIALLAEFRCKPKIRRGY